MTTFDRIAALVDEADFTGLFISELGWDNPSDVRPVRYVERESSAITEATPVASKRGVIVYHCASILDRPTLEALDREIEKRSIERLLVLTGEGEQQWRWPEPRKSGGTRYVLHKHRCGVPNPALFQRLGAVRFLIEEEDRLTVLAVRERVRAQFNADEVTNRFYEEFRQNQLGLMDEIEGIDPDEERSWYSSLLLNRLMFIYFMQRKAFLNGDQNYLRTSLRRVRELDGPDRFYDYYRDFLIPLFHEGLGSDEHRYADDRVAAIIGSVPYVNGGIFALHPLEVEYDIRIPDETFEGIFDFFDRYRWHLDERPTGNPEEINPEILGYIFEKYVNQKEQGAYYTQEDVTGYMASRAILPVVLERMSCAVDAQPWHLLQAAPQRYLPEGLRYGADENVPDVVAAADRYETGVLDEPADPNLGLPGERWRETLARRESAARLGERLEAGGITSVSDALTANLHIQRLALDWIVELGDEGRAADVWDVLSGLKIVDPTCGSGAFLFAALDLLEELYDGVLVAAELAIEKGVSDGRTRALVDEVASHASREYFLLKRAVLANLYGVDLMPEATEIARLRLFLALVARLDDRSEVEPLPDLDMNIRAGNLLVGCSTPEDAQRRFAGNLFAIERLELIAQRAAETADVYREFVEAQRTRVSAAEVNEIKRRFQATTQILRADLDLLYSPMDAEGPEQEAWKESHRPFHWFVEFPEVMTAGGFDAVIGNPPYVAKNKVTHYRYNGFATDAAPDIFAPCMERAASLVRSAGGYAMIVPISFQFSDRYAIAREAVAKEVPARWVSTYSRNPAALFDAGLGVRSTIIVGLRSAGEHKLATTELRRWREEYRPYLFDTNQYSTVLCDDGGVWPRLGHPGVADLYVALTAAGQTVNDAVRRSGPTVGHKKIALYYLSVFIDTPPAWTADGKRIEQHESAIHFESEDVRDVAFMLLSGRMALWWWTMNGDDFNVPTHIFKSFPIAPKQVLPVRKKLISLAKRLRAEQPKHPSVTLYAGKEIGNYDLNRCRHITDEAERLILECLGLGEYWPMVLLADARSQKATGERPGTEREWPFPW